MIISIYSLDTSRSKMKRSIHISVMHSHAGVNIHGEFFGCIKLWILKYIEIFDIHHLGGMKRSRLKDPTQIKEYPIPPHAKNKSHVCFEITNLANPVGRSCNGCDVWFIK